MWLDFVEKFCLFGHEDDPLKRTNTIYCICYKQEAPLELAGRKIQPAKIPLIQVAVNIVSRWNQYN